MITSDQIRAARALLRMDQRDLASRAHVSVATVRRVESGADASKGSPRAVEAVQHALEAAGAEFIDHGVRCRKRRTPGEIEERVRAIAEISEHYLRLATRCPDTFFTDDDLYDENGLPV